MPHRSPGPGRPSESPALCPQLLATMSDARRHAGKACSGPGPCHGATPGGRAHRVHAGSRHGVGVTGPGPQVAGSRAELATGDRQAAETRPGQGSPPPGLTAPAPPSSSRWGHPGGGHRAPRPQHGKGHASSWPLGSGRSKKVTEEPGHLASMFCPGSGCVCVLTMVCVLTAVCMLTAACVC